MKKVTLILVALLAISFSCKNNEKKNETSEKDSTYSESEYNESTPGTLDESTKSSRDTLDEEQREDKSETSSSGSINNTTYLKQGEENDYNCKCYCIEMNLSGTSELCLAKDKIYIDASFKKSADSINVYYVQPSAKNTNKDLPWNKFDKNQPIAVITPTGGGLKLDWKGFSIDGKLALDYAIYGKKTLEGEYKIK